MIIQSGELELRDSYIDTVIGGQAQKESIISGIITLLTPAPLKHPYAMKNQRKARNAPSREHWVPSAGSL